MTATGGTLCLALAANLFVVPALANALTLKPFTYEAMNMIGTHSVGYMGALNYDVAYYSRRNMPIVSIWSGPRPDYLIAWSEEFMRLSPSTRAQFRTVLVSHPTELDGRGAMVLLRCEPASGPPRDNRTHPALHPRPKANRLDSTSEFGYCACIPVERHLHRAGRPCWYARC